MSMIKNNLFCFLYVAYKKLEILVNFGDNF